MQKYWVKRAENRRLLIFIAGWGSDLRDARYLDLAGYDLLYVYDFRSVEPLQPDEVAGYEQIDLMAWSFGVWVAEQVAGPVCALPEAQRGRRVAINGTPLMVHDRYGIPARPFQLTLRGMPRAGTEPFMRRAYGPYFETCAQADERALDELCAELDELYRTAILPYVPTLTWDFAVVGVDDRIIPPQNMTLYWSDHAPATRQIHLPAMPHVPFSHISFIVDLLK